MKAPSRLRSLDALRGLAALSVVLFHWIFWLGDAHGLFRPGLTEHSLPAYEALRFFYLSGDTAVSLFFSLSGFIFYWLYRDPIRSGLVRTKEFSVARLSRLYPLQLMSLLIVAGAQAAYASVNQGLDWIFGPNDALHFMKHLLLFPLWAPHRDITFNVPDWTLAIEVLLYVIFFFVARWGSLRWGGTLLMLAASAAVGSCYSQDIGRGMACFYMGGVAYLIFERIESPQVDRILRILLGVSWPVAFVLGSGYIDIHRTRLAFLDGVYATYFLFPATILSLALFETRRGGVSARLQTIGDLSYSSYLLHFPLMVIVAFSLSAMHQSPDVMLGLPALAGFFAVLVPLSLVCHHKFERPMQSWLRSQLMPPARSAEDATTLHSESAEV